MKVVIAKVYSNSNPKVILKLRIISYNKFKEVF